MHEALKPANLRAKQRFNRTKSHAEIDPSRDSDSDILLGDEKQPIKDTKEAKCTVQENLNSSGIGGISPASTLCDDSSNKNLCDTCRRFTTTWKNTSFDRMPKDILSRPRLAQSALYVLKLLIGYLIMIAFMRCNSLFCLSILLGSGLGHLMFGFNPEVK